MMKILQRLLLLVLLCTPLLILGGCWSSEELHDRAFARLLLLDKAENGIELTIGFPLPNRLSSGKAGGGDAGGASAKPFTFVTKTGKDIGDAYRQIQSDVPRRITFGQLRNILIGKELAQEGIQPIADFAAREPAIHVNSNLFVTEGKVKDFIDIPVVFERFPTDILTAYAETKVIVPVTVRDLLMSVYIGGDILLPRLVFGRKGAEAEENGDKWMGTNGAVIFRQGRMVGLLGTHETRTALWILGELENSEFSIPSPHDGKPVDFLVWGAKTKITPHVDGNRIRFTIKSHAEATLLATKSTINLTDVDNLNAMQKSLQTQLADRISSAIEATKRMKSDAFQLGNYIKWRYPQTWKRIKPEWRELYSDSVRVEPIVDIKVRWYGTAQKPEWNRILLTKEKSQ